MVTVDPALYEREGETGVHRRQIVSILEEALDAVDPATAVKRHLRRERDALFIGDVRYDLDDFSDIYVVGAGKAGAPMAQAVEEVLGDRITAGCMNVKYGYALPTQRIELTEAAHPIPDQQGVEGTRRIAELLDEAESDDLVLCLISGGGSALMTLPVEGVTLEDMKALTDALLRAGATINEINAIRKHVDRLKGGKLARLASPARVASLILSDVVGDPLDVIASGPTVPDTSTFAEAYSLLERYELLDRVPASVVEHLRRGKEGEIEETPKPGDAIFAASQNVVVASNEIAARAAAHKATDLGFSALLLSTFVEGEAREVAKVFVALAKEIRNSGNPVPCPACIVAGGETTVTLRGDGEGGRNQEMALSAAIGLDGMDDVAIVCLATDGTDGPTDASGALADGTTLQRARERGLDAWSYLENNDSYRFFEPLDDLLMTGPTNTNVNDLTFVFVW
ncbi:MAG: glycerate kinase [Chloroflexota bacterium]|nr:glycerate kinase [Chloroflexota bacterium]